MSGSSRRLRGYLMVGGTAVMFGGTGVWVGMTDLPASTLLFLRMALAALLVIALGGGRRWVRQSLQPGVLRRLLVLGVLDALQLYTFILALRELGVALAVFLSYMSPIYIALVAPRLLGQRTERVVVGALALAVAGIAVMLAPGLVEPDLHVSPLGVGLGLTSGLLLAAFFLAAKPLSSDVDGTTMLISNGVIVAAITALPGLIQWADAGFVFAPADLWAVVGLAVFSTALGGSIFLHGMRYIPVQHTSIVGLLEPASAPVFALVFLTERPSVWTLLGGAFILCGAVPVVVFGAAEEGLAGSPEEVVGEAEALTPGSAAPASGSEALAQTVPAHTAEAPAHAVRRADGASPVHAGRGEAQ